MHTSYTAVIVWWCEANFSNLLNFMHGRDDMNNEVIALKMSLNSLNSRRKSWRRQETGEQIYIQSLCQDLIRIFWENDTNNHMRWQVWEKGWRGRIGRSQAGKSWTWSRSTQSHCQLQIKPPTKPTWTLRRTLISFLSAVSRFDLERAREEADEKKGRAERARQEYGVQVSPRRGQDGGQCVINLDW